MDFENYLSSSSLSNNLRTLINHLLNHSIGTINDGQFDDVGINVYDLATGRPCIDYCSTSSPRIKDVCDRFKLKIPYCGKHIIWEVVFNSMTPEDPPDFNLNDEHFIRSIDPDTLEQFVPSLINWKYDDPSSLKNVIKEFIAFYKKYQFDQLKKDNYCSIEYVSIVKTGLINEDDVEVFVTNNGLVYFLIRLCPDLSDYRVNRPREHYAGHIAMCFNTNSGKKMAKPQVRFTPALKEFLKPKPGSNDITDSSNLAEFLVKLNEKIEESLSPAFLKPIAKRKRFIFEWLSVLGRKVIEFDAIRFQNVSFLLENDGFNYILLVNLHKGFTTVPPDYKFQSVYSQKPLIISIDAVPYNPNWSFKTMMTRAINFIETKIPTFRKICIDNI